MVPEARARPRAPTKKQVMMNRKIYCEMLHRTTTLGIPSAAVYACVTMAALKVLAHQAFRVLAKQWHPDVVQHSGVKQWHHMTRGARYRQFQRAHEWFKRQNDALILPHRVTIPELPMPWALEPRAIALPAGYNETRDYLWYR